MAAKPIAREQVLERRLVSQQSAAEYGACSVTTIRRRIASGELTAYRFGPRLLRVDLDELDALLRPVPAVGRIA